jgi:hypothetical protein
MVNLLGRGAALASCVLVFGWSAPPGTWFDAHASDRAGTVGDPSTSVAYPAVSSPFSLLVSPTRLVVPPADIGKVGRFLVVNRGQDPVLVTVRKQNFSGGADGTLAFQQNAPYAAADWIAVRPDRFELAPGATQAVTAAVTVPAAPEPGDHQVAIVFLVPAGQNGANVRINRGIATPVYITVPGPTDDSASVTGLRAPGFVMGGPVDIAARVRDTGTVHRDFRGASRLTVDIGRAVLAFPDFTVLRDSIRDVSTTWQPPLMCVCHPTVSIVDAGGVVRTVSVRVVVFPLYQLGILIAVLVLLVLIIRRWHRGLSAASTRAAHRARPDGGGDA